MRMLTPARIALIYCAFAALWILASDYLGSFLAQSSTAFLRLELLKGLLFVVTTTALLYLLLKLRERGMPQGADAEIRTVALRPAIVVVFFLLLALAAPLLGLVTIKLHGPTTEARVRANLEVITQLKVERVEQWLDTRETDARLLAANAPLFAHAARLVREQEPVLARAVLQQGLVALRKWDYYQGFLLLEPDGRPLLAEGEQTAMTDELRAAVAHSREGHQVSRTELYRDTQGVAHLDWVVPIRSGPRADGALNALLVLRSDPRQLLTPLTQWPSAYATGEVLLLRRAGDQVQFLSDSFRAEQRRPVMMQASEHVAVVALRRAEPGAVDGTDYQGRQVLAVYRPVAGSDWRVVTKVDHDEVLRPLWKVVWTISAVALAFVLIISLSLLLLWRQQVRLQSLLALARKVRSEHMLQQFFSMSFIGMAVVFPDGKRFEQVNDYLCEVLGYRADELIEKSCLTLTHPDDLETEQRELAMMQAGNSNGYMLEKRLLRQDGSSVPVIVDTRCSRRPDGSIDRLLVTVQDISHHKAAEARIFRLTQAYAALSQCNQAIVRCTDTQALFGQICEIIVTYGGMRLAWIGLIDPQQSTVEPVASFGDDTGYLDGIVISLDPAHPYGNGPTARAMQSNEAYWCQDFAGHQATQPWRDRSGGRFGASAAIPITRAGGVVGAVCMYAAERNAFDDEIKALLIEMASDISFALDNLERETQRSQAEQQLAESEAKFHLLFNRSPDGLLIVDDSVIVECNPAVLEMLGCQREQVINMPIWTLSPSHQPDGRTSGDRVMEITERFKTQELLRFEWTFHRFNGEEFPVEVTMVPIVFNGRRCAYNTWRDISEQKRAEAQIRYLAQYDTLTDLPNRTLLADRVAHAISAAQRNQTGLALLFFDLDRFKSVNDSWGHVAGDEMLREVARRLQGLVREQDTVARLSSDEFVVVLPDTGMDGASRVAEKIIATVTRSYHIMQHDFAITSSIGIAVYPEDGGDFSTLLKSADIAMYRAKQTGRNSYHFYTTKMQQDTARTLQLEAALQHAIEQGQFSLEYQPQYSLRRNVIVGAEALLRWHHPELGRISPAEFIPIAEDAGHILRIGEWVLQQAIAQLKTWHADGLDALKVAVNLSAVQFKHPRLPDTIDRLLREAGMTASCLELELTESVSMDDPVAAVVMMDRLATLGIRMSIDDFGTGYSSLSYLKRFKAYQLKIDQTFVRDIMTDADDRAIVNSIISMARSLGMNAIAEGVETREQLDFLRAAGCDEIQGYYFSRPLAADDFVTFCKAAAVL